jgi:uncharacterized membrane protein YphA (DoxX/SURF4 family)
MRWILTLLVGAFLVLDAIAGLVGISNYIGQIGAEFGASGRTVTLVLAIVELLAGALLLLGLFFDLGQLDGIVGLVILGAWILVIIFTYFIGNFRPDALGWWTGFVQSLIILVVFWIVKGRRA